MIKLKRGQVSESFNFLLKLQNKDVSPRLREKVKNLKKVFDTLLDDIFKVTSKLDRSELVDYLDVEIEISGEMLTPEEIATLEAAGQYERYPNIFTSQTQKDRNDD